MTGEQHRQRRQRQVSPPVDLAQRADTDGTDNDACGNIGLGLEAHLVTLPELGG